MLEYLECWNIWNVGMIGIFGKTENERDLFVSEGIVPISDFLFFL